MQTAPVLIVVSAGENSDTGRTEWNVIVGAGIDSDSRLDSSRALFAGPFTRRADANHEARTAKAVFTACGVQSMMELAG